MSVASRAPIEILGEIFLILRDKPIALHDLKNSSHFDEFPWAVKQLCSHWRSAFLSYPALWTSLSLENPEFKQPSPRAPYVAEMNRRTAIYLKRSKQHALTITVRASNPCLSTMWIKLLSCSNRWKKAYLWIENESVLDGLVGRRGEMRILESLRVILTEFKGQMDPMAFEIAPRLTELEFKHWARMAEWTRRRWTFPWIQLSKLRLEVASLDFTCGKTFRTFLLQIQNVEELRLLLTYSHARFGYFKCPSVRFPRLRLLEISFSSPGVLSWFEAPLLDHLLLHDTCRDDAGSNDHIEELSSFLHRSSCCVRCLTFQGCDIDVSRDIIEELKVGVEELCVGEMVEALWGDFLDFVRDMIQSYDIHLPKLRVFQVECCPEHFQELIPKESFFDEDFGVPLEKLIVAVDGNNCGSDSCQYDVGSTAIDNALNAICRWPSFSVVCLNYDQRNLVLTLHALVASAVVDLTIYYPKDPKVHRYCSEESCRHYNILLENKRLAVHT